MAGPAELDEEDTQPEDTVPPEKRRTTGNPASVLPPVNPALGWIEDTYLDRYKRDRQLGKGSMGEVHLCKDGRIGRDVAMKAILPDHGADAQARRACRGSSSTRRSCRSTTSGWTPAAACTSR
jgi:hypothetical protein